MVALRKVLVVDDDPVVGKSFNRVLTKDKGYVVITAKSGAEALEKMRSQSYDVVFTDIKMPGMDGVELAERVKASQPWLPVVIITGYGTSDNEARAKAAGVCEFVHKPLSPEMIEGSAEHALWAPLAAAEVHATPQTQPEVRTSGHGFRDVALFLASPFIALAYAVLLPLVGLAMLAWEGSRALLQNKTAMVAIKNVALLAVAPFVGLVYAVLLPLVGIAMLAWQGGRALLKISPTTGKWVLLGAAPFIGLAYAVLLPLIGLGMLAWMGGKALLARPQIA